MAKPPASSDSIMPVSALRPLLKLVKDDGAHEISCAICLTGAADPEGVMLLDKRMAPKKLRMQLIKQAKEAGLDVNVSTVRYGRASLDETDETVLRITLNLMPSGSKLHDKLKRRIKPAGFADLVFVVDETLENEDAATEQSGASEGAPPLDPAALSARLGLLIKGVNGLTDAKQMAELGALIREAGGQLKEGRLTDAAGAMARIEAGLAAGAAVRVAKGLLLWNGTRSYVKAQLGKLREEILKQASAEADFAEIKASLPAIDAIMERLDDRLSASLDKLRGTADPAAKTRLSEEARTIVGEYQAYVAGDRLMNAIDDNGFVPLDVKPRVESALKAILHTI